MSEHPAITGEVQPVRLEASKCLRLGYKSGVCYSSAAGAYQFIKPTWISLRDEFPRLTDFSPASQDQAAIRLLERIGALRLIRAGEIEKAITLAGSQWASLPGSTAGQNPKSMQIAVGYFNAGGGVA
jgi:lysozyme